MESDGAPRASGVEPEEAFAIPFESRPRAGLPLVEKEVPPFPLARDEALRVVDLDRPLGEVDRDERPREEVEAAVPGDLLAEGRRQEVEVDLGVEGVPDRHRSEGEGFPPQDPGVRPSARAESPESLQARRLRRLPREDRPSGPRVEDEGSAALPLEEGPDEQVARLRRADLEPRRDGRIKRGVRGPVPRGVERPGRRGGRRRDAGRLVPRLRPLRVRTDHAMGEPESEGLAPILEPHLLLVPFLADPHLRREGRRAIDLDAPGGDAPLQAELEKKGAAFAPPRSEGEREGAVRGEPSSRLDSGDDEGDLPVAEREGPRHPREVDRPRVRSVEPRRLGEGADDPVDELARGGEAQGERGVRPDEGDLALDEDPLGPSPQSLVARRAAHSGEHLLEPLASGETGTRGVGRGEESREREKEKEETASRGALKSSVHELLMPSLVAKAWTAARI